ncbi:hypothetical protein P3S67_000947 [Capsicum chacoense]
MATLKPSFISQTFFYFITLFFIFLILVHSNDDAFKNSDPKYSSSFTSTSTTRATMRFYPRKIPKNHHEAEYGAAAHEVPSGPNPISNR